MNYHREFEIGWFGLALGAHEFEYEMDQDKLARLSYPEIESINNFRFDIKLHFNKKSSFFLLKFELSGIVTSVCDRCGDLLDMEIWDEFDLVVKLTHDTPSQANGEEEDADVVFINRNDTVIDISEWIYEFIQLSLPIQRIHPDDAQGKSTCNPNALAVLATYQADETEETTDTASDEQEEPVQKAKDIWKDLDKFKF